MYCLQSLYRYSMSFSVFSVDGISGNKGFMLSKLAGCWLAVTWVQNIAEFSDKRRLVCEPRFIASRSSHTPHHHYLHYLHTLGHQTLNLEMYDTVVKRRWNNILWNWGNILCEIKVCLKNNDTYFIKNCWFGSIKINNCLLNDDAEEVIGTTVKSSHVKSRHSL